MLSKHPNSAARSAGRPRFSVFVNLASLHARPGVLGSGQPGEVEVKRHRRPKGLDNWRLVTEAATRMNKVSRNGAA